MIIYISSNIYSFIRLDKDICFESSLKHDEIKLNCSHDFFLTATPINNNDFLPTYAKVIVSQNKITCENKNIVIIKHDLLTYEIIVLFEKMNKNSLFFEKNIEKNIKLTIFSSEVVIQKEKEFHKKSINFIFSDFDFIDKANYLYLIFYNNNKVNLLIYDKQSSSFMHHSCNKLVSNSDKLTLITKNLDYIKSYSLLEISLSDNIKIYSIAKKYSTDKISTNENIIPFAFIQAIKIKDFSLARKYLSQQFSNSLQDEHLENFFGNFIKPVVPKVKLPKNSLSLIYKKDELLFAKHFTFTFENGKIIDISEH